MNVKFIKLLFIIALLQYPCNSQSTEITDLWTDDYTGWHDTTKNVVWTLDTYHGVFLENTTHDNIFYQNFSCNVEGGVGVTYSCNFGCKVDTLASMPYCSLYVGEPTHTTSSDTALFVLDDTNRVDLSTTETSQENCAGNSHQHDTISKAFSALSTSYNHSKKYAAGEVFEIAFDAAITASSDVKVGYLAINNIVIECGVPTPSTASPTSKYPSFQPTNYPSLEPTIHPTFNPSSNPSVGPTSYPTATHSPSNEPTSEPSNEPSYMPSLNPTYEPTFEPSLNPTLEPTNQPSNRPTLEPTTKPNQVPSSAPSKVPSSQPSSIPSTSPSEVPSANPTTTSTPTLSPLSSSPTTPAPTPSGTESELVRLVSIGTCDLTCVACLDTVDIWSTDDDTYYLDLNSDDVSNCTCPVGDATSDSDSDSDDDSIAVAYNTSNYSLVLSERDNSTIQVVVQSWMGDEINNCTVLYSVNHNYFLGVYAKNVLIIVYVECNVPVLSEQNITNAETIAVEKWSAIFNNSLYMNASIVQGSFANYCNSSASLGISTTDTSADTTDQMTVVTITFSDADDASSASDSACSNIASSYCATSTASTDDETDDEDEDDDDEDEDDDDEIAFGLNAGEFAGVVIGCLCCFAIIFVSFYLFAAWKKKRDTELLKQGTTDLFGESSGWHMGVTQKSVRVLDADTIISNIGEAEKREEIKMDDEEKEAVLEMMGVTKPSGPIYTTTTGIEVGLSKSRSRVRGRARTRSLADSHVMKTGPDGFAKLDYFQLEEEVDALEMTMSPEVLKNTSLNRNEPEDEKVKKMDSSGDMIEDVTEKQKAVKIEYADLAFDKEPIGSGQFGKVFIATWGAERVAVKTLNPIAKLELDLDADIDDEEAVQALPPEQQDKIRKYKKQLQRRKKEMHSEIVLASSIPYHPNLVHIYGFVQEPLCMVMGYMRGGSAKQYFYRKPELTKYPTFREKLVVLQKAAAGINFLHKYGLFHRDIAARNILLGNLSKGVIEEGTDVRIADFGMTRSLEETEATAGRSATNYGPLKWMAPESITDKEYSAKSDAYMWGVTMYEIFYGIEPYPNMTPVNVAMAAVHQKQRPTTPDFAINKTVSDSDPEFESQSLSREVDVSKLAQAPEARYYVMPEKYEALMKMSWNQDKQKRPSFQTIMHKLEKIVQMRMP